MSKLSFKGIVEVLKNSFKGFSKDKVLKLSASLAYYTVFSLGPLLIVIIFLCGIFLAKEAIEGSIYTQMQGFVGEESAKQMQDIVKNASVSDKGIVAAVIGIITLLIGATSVFGEIQDSINGIWGLKPKPKAGFMKLIKIRLLSFGIIGSLGFLLLVSLAVTAIVEGLNNRLKDVFPDVTVVVFYIVNIAITLGVVTLLFAVIFKVLPDAKLKWKDVWAGAIATALLFMIGKFAISFYISKSEIGSTYGAAGSFVVLLVWIYYSSVILYFGAEFTKAYVVKYGSKIQPAEYAVLEKDAAPGEPRHAQHKETDTRQAEKKEKQQNTNEEHYQHEGSKHSITESSFVYEDEHLPVDVHHKNKKTEKSAGVGTLLLGLAIFFIRNASKDAAKDAKKIIRYKPDFD